MSYQHIKYHISILNVISVYNFVHILIINYNTNSKYIALNFVNTNMLLHNEAV